MLNSIVGQVKSFANMPSVIILSSMVAGQFVLQRFGTTLLPDYKMYDDVLAASAFALAIFALIPSSALPTSLRQFDLVDY